MYSQISIYEKKDFIKWFLKKYQLKQREAVWILTYLIENDELLIHTHFVNDAKYCPRAMVLTSTCSNQVPFLFFKGKIMTDNPDKLFHDIRLNPDETLYIQLNFKQAEQAPFYASILEDNPFAPFYWQMRQQDQEISERLIEQFQFDHQKHLLESEIDEALDKKDEIKFLKLVRELEQVLKKENVKE